MGATWGRRRLQVAEPEENPSDGITALHLAREMVWADRTASRAHYQGQFETVEIFHAYREQCAAWRYGIMRGQEPPDLHQCPWCGHVQQLPPGLIQCWRCRARWFGGMG